MEIGAERKAEFDTARYLIKSAYKLRDEIEQCRHPFVDAGVLAESQGKRDPDEDGKAWANVYESRWGPLYIAALRAEAKMLHQTLNMAG